MLPRLQTGLLLFFALTTGILGTIVYQTITQNSMPPATVSVASPTPEPSPTTSSTIATQLTQIQDDVSALTERVETLEKDPSSTTPTPTVVTTKSAFQKQTIFLGSSSTTNRDWTDSGIEIKLTSADYPTNAPVVFEAGLSIIGGESWARLRNKTTGAVISVSEISHGTSTTTWKSSSRFTLHPGENVYVVQIRSSSGETAHLSGARLVIGE